MSGALRRWLIVAGAVAALAGCQGSDPFPSAAPATRASARSIDCPTPEAGQVEPGSVLVPGPSNGLPRSDAPSERLLIVATVLGPDCRPAAGATVNLWHTDSRGDYGNEQVECCYYWGTVRTDQAGRFQLDSVRPGQYREPNSPPAHIHLEISHATGRLMAEMVFGDDPARPPRGHGDSIPVALRESGDGADKTWRGEVTFIVGR